MTSAERLLLVRDISPDPEQPRKRFPEEHIKGLAASIASRGLIQAITVRPWPRGATPYMIVAGECRWRAHVLISKARIKAVVRTDIDAKEVRLISIVENLQRRDMNAMEEARAFKLLADDGYPIPRIVSELGYKSANYVKSKMDLLTLLPEIQQLVETDNLPAPVAWGISQVPHQYQRKMLHDYQTGKLDTLEKVRHAGIAIREAVAQPDIFTRAPKASKRDLEKLTALEREIASMVDFVKGGFKDGEVVAAQRVNPGRVEKMADQLLLIRKHVQLMEHDLRRVAVKSEIQQDLLP